jgi:large subunit ribosomal protein L6
MSRIGKQPIQIPVGVEVKTDGARVSVKGPKGELSTDVHPSILVENTGDALILRPKQEGDSFAIWGLSRALIFNMIKGATEGFDKRLEIEGVGYRAQVEGRNLVLQLGFSHKINFPIPEGINVNVKDNVIDISGIDKQLVGQVAASIRSFRKPEPYKGKGIHYKGEHIRRKEGKKAAAA